VDGICTNKPDVLADILDETSPNRGAKEDEAF
jgi:hypothetical protein